MKDNTMKKILFFLFSILYLPVIGQNNVPGMEVEMADKFRADGKIYVVIIVVGIILIGLFTYLILLDRKIGKIEKEIDLK